MATGPHDRRPITLLEEIFPGDTNPYGTAFGGKIIELMDRAAALAASRYAHNHFVTASLEGFEFRAAVRQGEIAEVVARVIYTSPRTCGIRVEVFAVDKTEWVRRCCGHGLIFMVAVGPDGKALGVPPLKPESKEERRDWAEAEETHRKILERKRRQDKS